ncbi:MAG: regulatory protein GemA [Smithellaceae bacterium]|nr:regulatory protein GemA [Smithellaceae bacterium]
MKIEAKQIQLIHIARAQLGLTDETYRAIIAGRSGGKKESSRELTYAEADAVINYMIRLGFKIKSKYVAREKAVKRAWRSGQRPNNVFCIATTYQLNMINALAGKIRWRVEDGFQRWMKKYIKIDQIRTDDEACKVIEGLKGMLINQDGDCD